MRRRAVDKTALAAMIDHTQLRVDASYGDIQRLCLEAEKHRFAAIVVHPVNVPLAARLLAGTDVRIATVVGFPTGAYTVAGKALETKDAVAKGAHEIGFVINVGALRAGNNVLVRDEMQAIARVAVGATTKAILETCLLTNEEKTRACQIAKEAGIDFVETSTAFKDGGATAEDVRLLREAVGNRMGVKASGDIETLQDVMAMVDAGATRIGTSSGVSVVEGLSD